MVYVHTVMVTVENTDPKCYWLTNYLEVSYVRVGEAMCEALVGMVIDGGGCRWDGIGCYRVGGERCRWGS